MAEVSKTLQLLCGGYFLHMAWAGNSRLSACYNIEKMVAFESGPRNFPTVFGLSGGHAAFGSLLEKRETSLQGQRFNLQMVRGRGRGS